MEIGSSNVSPAEKVVRITTLGRFVLEVNGQAVQFGRKAPTRLLDFLKVLITAGPRGISKSKLVDLLWTEAEGDAGQETLRKSLQRLRRLLGGQNAICVIRGALSLNPEVCWIDAWALERASEQIENRIEVKGEDKVGTEEERQAAWLRTAQEAMALYRGPFLADEEDTDWIEGTRDRLRRRYLTIVRWLSEHWQRLGESEKSIACLDGTQGFSTLQKKLDQVHGF
jgi:DNA-binding SARP family transcriptional activator